MKSESISDLNWLYILQVAIYILRKKSLACLEFKEEIIIK